MIQKYIKSTIVTTQVKKKMAKSNSDPPNTVLIRMFMGYRITQALYVIAKLGIADFLIEKPKNADKLANELSIKSNELFRVLRLLASVGVLSQNEHNEFSLTQIGQFLRTDKEDSIRNLIIFQGETTYHAFGSLLQTIQKGVTAFELAYGEGHFEYLAKHPELSEIFNQAMAVALKQAGNPFSDFNFTIYKTIVDLGGGNGTLLSVILKENHHLQGILFDLPNAISDARNLFSSNGLEGRYKIKTGSIFESVPTGGDIYILSRVLHDWPDEKALILLRNCRKVMPEKGFLLIREGVLPDNNVQPSRLLLDINMMVMTGGKERTEKEWNDLLKKSGFLLHRILKTNTNQDLIEAKPI